MNEKTASYWFPLIKGILLGLALLGLMGCANSNGSNSSGSSLKEIWTYSDGVPRRMEADYGRSVINNRLEMMVTPPDAVSSLPATGLPPKAAKNAQERYDKSFTEKEETKKVQMLIQ